MLINLYKTKEIVLYKHHPNRWSLPQFLEGIEQALSAKLLGVIFRCTFSFVHQVDYILKTCSQHIFLLKRLRDQGLGLTLQNLHIVLTPLAYAESFAVPFPCVGSFT